MKFLNHFSRLSDNEQLAFTTWLYSTLSLWSMLLIAIVSVSMLQWYRYYKMATFIKPSSTTQLEQQRTQLLQEKSSLEKKILDERTQPSFYLAMLAELLPAEVLLTTYTFERSKSITLAGKAQSQESLQQCIHAIEQWMVGKKVCIKHVHKNDNELEFTIVIPW